MQNKKWTVEEIEELLALTRTLDVISLNKKINDDDSFSSTELGELLIDDSKGPQEIVEERETKQTLINYVNKLEPRQCVIIKLRFGLEDGNPKTLEEVAKIYGVTRERIRQIEQKGLRKLRWLITNKGKYKHSYEV